MSDVTIFSTATCPLCEKSKTLLTKWGIAYDVRSVDSDAEALKEMAVVSNGARSVPQIVIKGKWIGGFSELTELKMDGDLDDLMS